MLKRLFSSVSCSVLGVASLCFAITTPLSAQAETLSVDLNKTQVLQLSAPASAVVVGNPAIADVSVHSPTVLFIVGRGYGTTNVIILDELGNVVKNDDIQVGFEKSAASKRVLKAGIGWETYDCAPFCQPTPMIGDTVDFRAMHSGQEKMIDDTSSPIANTSFSGQPSGMGSAMGGMDGMGGMAPTSYPEYPSATYPSQLQKMRVPFPNR